MLAIVDPWSGTIWFIVVALVAAGLLWAGWWAVRGRRRWLLMLPALVAVGVLWVAFDTLVLAPTRWERDGVCSGWWQEVPTFLPDGSYNHKPELCIAPM